MTKKKFSASEWKDSVDKDLSEIKLTILAMDKAIGDIYTFISIFEQWRRAPFNNPLKGEKSETNTKKESRNTNSSSTGKTKSKGKNLRRKARAKSK
jgi:hypothetical protein